MNLTRWAVYIKLIITSWSRCCLLFSPVLYKKGVVRFPPVTGEGFGAVLGESLVHIHTYIYTCVLYSLNNAVLDCLLASSWGKADIFVDLLQCWSAGSYSTSC